MPTEASATVRAVWPLLLVQNIECSLAFYRDQLGFHLVEQAEAGERIYWCRLSRDGACLMLQQAEAEDLPLAASGRGISLYFLCDDVDELHHEFQSRGLDVDPPQVAYYGMKELFVPEPDGYSICFESLV